MSFALAVACSEPVPPAMGDAEVPEPSLKGQPSDRDPDASTRPPQLLRASRGGAVDPASPRPTPDFLPGLPCPGASPVGDGLRFSDVTDCAGIEAYHQPFEWQYYAMGQAWGDYDGDGFLDLYLTTLVGPNVLYRNRGDGAFEVSPLSPTVELESEQSSGANFADYDNDGWSDLLVLGHGPNHLFHNEQGTRFTEVTDQAGIEDMGRGSTASFGDYDADGHIDLYVANWADYDVAGPEASSDRLFHNEGDGTFRDVTFLFDPSLVVGAGFVAAFVDYDNDSDLDIYLVNDKGYPGSSMDGRTNHTVLFRNDGPGCEEWCFASVAIEEGAELQLAGMGIAVGDYDNDQDLDLYVSNVGPMVFLENRQPGGGFLEVAEPLGVQAPDGFGWGTVFIDADNDGYLDLYLADSYGDNRFFRNLEGVLFEDVSENSGANDPGDSEGVAYADYDRDGRVDLIVGNRAGRFRLYRNVTPIGEGGGSIRLRLQGGPGVNRDAIGARVTIRTSDGRVLMQEVQSGSSLGAGNDLALHFGLGPATVENVHVRWPDGSERTFGPLAPGCEWRIRSQSPEPEPTVCWARP